MGRLQCDDEANSEHGFRIDDSACDLSESFIANCEDAIIILVTIANMEPR
jgi:hypothetical protein